MLDAEEKKRLDALSLEEEEKVAALRKMSEEVEVDIVKIKELIDSLKKEMGNEDLPLLQVSKDTSTHLF